MSNNSVSQRLIIKIMASFLMLMVLVGVSYVLMTFYFTSKYFEETTQKLNAEVANHLIEEKFQNASPFLEDGSVNKPLFGDLMHDMMAVNRGIEVYLLDSEGVILYSVVLDHSSDEKTRAKVDLEPIQKFMACKGGDYILGDDPRNPENQKIFSAAPFSVDGNEGYIYIILASQRYEEVTSSLIGSYFLKLGVGASITAVLFAAVIGLISIWYLTKNLRSIVESVKRFKDGDLSSRVPNASENDLSLLAETYNDMADTIVANIEELKSVESLRRELIANVSHDLRTPLAIMQGYVETLQMKVESLNEDERNKYLGIIQKSIEKLSGLIAQLFEYSKLEAKQIEPKKEPFPISDLAHDVGEKYQQLASEKGIQIQLDIEKNLPLVFADISLVERVIQNLMDNALNYTPKDGRVTIQLNSDQKNVIIAIKDTGPGIPEEEQSYIFERFKKASSSKAGQGTGLGLAIAKKIIEIHESTIRVISKPDQGTEFRFSLPLYTA